MDAHLPRLGARGHRSRVPALRDAEHGARHVGRRPPRGDLPGPGAGGALPDRRAGGTVGRGAAGGPPRRGGGRRRARRRRSAGREQGRLPGLAEVEPARQARPARERPVRVGPDVQAAPLAQEEDGRDGGALADPALLEGDHAHGVRKRPLGAGPRVDPAREPGRRLVHDPARLPAAQRRHGRPDRHGQDQRQDRRPGRPAPDRHGPAHALGVPAGRPLLGLARRDGHDGGGAEARRDLLRDGLHAQPVADGSGLHGLGLSARGRLRHHRGRSAHRAVRVERAANGHTCPRRLHPGVGPGVGGLRRRQGQDRRSARRSSSSTTCVRRRSPTT